MKRHRAVHAQGPSYGARQSACVKFGSARVQSQRRGRRGIVVQAAGNLSPEQGELRDIDAKAAGPEGQSKGQRPGLVQTSPELLGGYSHIQIETSLFIREGG